MEMMTLGINLSEEANKVRNEVFELRESKKAQFLKVDKGNSAKYTSIAEALKTDSIAMCKEISEYRDGTHPQLGNTSAAAVQKIDISFSEMLKARYGIQSVDEYLTLMGLNTQRTTVANFTQFAGNINNPALVANVILEAVRLGLMKSSMYQLLISRQVNVEAATITVPYVSGISDPVQELSEGATIRRTKLKVGSKTITTTDLAQGISFTAKEIKFIRLDMLTHFFMEAQMQMSHKLDSMAYDVLVNGNESNESAPIIGVATANSLTWEDMRRPQVQMSILGKPADLILSSVTSDLKLMAIPEFKGAMAGTGKLQTIKSTIPLPQELNEVPSMWCGDNLLWLVDTSQALQMVVSSPLQFENEKNILSQEFNFVCTMYAAFVKGARDAAVGVDYSLAFASNGFPEYMNLETYKKTIIQ